MKANDIGKMLDVYAIHVAKNSLGEPVARYAIEAYVAELKDRAEKAGRIANFERSLAAEANDRAENAETKLKDLHGRVTELRERAEGAEERAERWHSRFKSEFSRADRAEAREQKATARERNLAEALLIAETKLMRVRECLKTLNRDGYRAAVRAVLDALEDK
jgi:chromosome segregation ATPase